LKKDMRSPSPFETPSFAWLLRVRGGGAIHTLALILRSLAQPSVSKDDG